MRFGECYTIMEEFSTNDIRYVEVGTKTEASRRAIPIPEAVLPLVPYKIEGPLFSGTQDSAEKRLNRFLRKLGFNERKTAHSLRHRAKSRLEALGCNEQTQHKILGHADGRVAGRYLHLDVQLKKEWLDKIGY
jgi:integrase